MRFSQMNNYGIYAFSVVKNFSNSCAISRQERTGMSCAALSAMVLHSSGSDARRSINGA